MSKLPMPTSGPVVSVHGDDETLATVNIEYKEPIAELKGRGPGHLAEENANADLIAAAFNAATAATDLGFDPIGAIEALPELLRAAKDAMPELHDNEAWCEEPIRTALSAARTRKAVS